jgi:hypothetical protein
MDDGITRIAAERKRQIEVEGWTKEHDAKHDGGELGEAAACYADIASAQMRGAGLEELRDAYIEGWGDLSWPLDDKWFKPSENPIRNLEMAGALIAAEIDRIQARGMCGTLRE